MSALLIATMHHRATEQLISARRPPWLYRRNVTLLHEDTALVGFRMQSPKYFSSELVIYFYCLISAVEKKKEQLGDTRQAGAKKKLGEWTNDLSLWNSELLINELLVGCMVLCSSPQV